MIGLDTETGIKASTDLDAVLATKPDCAVYTAMADNRLMEALEDYRRILAAGVNVVGSGPVFLQWPWQVIPDDMVSPSKRLRDKESRASSSTVSTRLRQRPDPLALTGTCHSIEQVRCMEIVNYATYDSPTVMFDVMGFGKPMDEIPMLLQPGVLSIGWGSVVRQLAAGLGLELDGLEEMYVREPAPESFDIASGHIAEGTATALRFEVIGLVDGARPSCSSTSPDCVMTCAPVAAARPGRRQLPRRDHRGSLLRTGPLSIEPQRRPQLRGVLATAMRVVNAIPAVVAAEPGICTTLNLPLVTGGGLYGSG